jgi:hypothetical protein
MMLRCLPESGHTVVPRLVRESDLIRAEYAKRAQISSSRRVAYFTGSTSCGYRRRRVRVNL